MEDICPEILSKIIIFISIRNTWQSQYFFNRLDITFNNVFLEYLDWQTLDNLITFDSSVLKYISAQCLKLLMKFITINT